eukprot:TRINITY_DN7308_c0_g1_i1.p1 TRINITY_DN7308_c0_g1~~TRINITY_DN7308_c0_g1_i1.p1  ORF type:complete len:715 (+),score=171.95 TRINITY_DN7308_c0_g1_i1:32-2176(+)
MEELIPLINRVQDVVSRVDMQTNPIDLPQIVVVGSQSSGKSSVLESIVGRDFLPRGSGIVTRRPLILQLSQNHDTEEEYGEFGHNPNKKYFDFKEIRHEIERVTDLETGENKGISSKSILLRIVSPSVLDLTLIDLPGITKVPVGDQPQDIEVLIREMILQFISKENAIILAVTPANSDIANSDALKLAKEVDPRGNRTVGVLTKLDLMDSGTDCLDILQGNIIKLKLGFIPVVNRSQKDVLDDTPIEVARLNEAKFFQDHPIYDRFYDKCGIEYLSSKLNKLLIAHIENCLPELRDHIGVFLSQTRSALADLGEAKYEQSKSALLLQIINKFTNTYCKTIEGSVTDRGTDELFGGARINYIFNEMFGRYIDQISDIGDLSRDDIRLTMTNATGPKASLFIPEDSFEQLAKRQVGIVEEPSFRCLELVYKELRNIVKNIHFPELERFELLHQELKHVVIEMIQSCLKPAKSMIKALISIETAYINTNHPDFIGGGNAVQELLKNHSDRLSSRSKREAENERRRLREQQIAMQKRTKEKERRLRDQERKHQKKERGFFHSVFGKSKHDKEQKVVPEVVEDDGYDDFIERFEFVDDQGLVPDATTRNFNMNPIDREEDDHESFQVELLEMLLRSYFSIVRKNAKDKVPKSIMYFLVNRSKESIQNELVKSLYKEEIYENLLEENPEITNQRRKLQDREKILSGAQRILSDITDFRI